MVANMTNSSFSIIGLENFIAMIPIMVHLTAKDKFQASILEPLATYLALVAIFILFYGHICCLSRQYLARNPSRSFFYLTGPPNDMIKTNK